MKNHEKVSKLAEAHWEYVKGLLSRGRASEGVLDLCEYIYITSFIHGYKHAIQDVENIKIRIKR